MLKLALTCSRSSFIFRGLTLDLFLSSVHFLVKAKQAQLSNCRSVKVSKNFFLFKNRNEFLFSDFPAQEKLYLLIQFFQNELLLKNKCQ